MTLDEFLSLTQSRLPTADELVALCDGLGIRFGRTPDGKPCLKVGNGTNKAAADLVARLLRREPWRAAALAAKGLDRTPGLCRKCGAPCGDCQPVDLCVPCACGW